MQEVSPAYETNLHCILQKRKREEPLGNHHKALVEDVPDILDTADTTNHVQKTRMPYQYLPQQSQGLGLAPSLQKVNKEYCSSEHSSAQYSLSSNPGNSMKKVGSISISERWKMHVLGVDRGEPTAMASQPLYHEVYGRASIDTAPSSRNEPAPHIAESRGPPPAMALEQEQDQDQLSLANNTASGVGSEEIIAYLEELEAMPWHGGDRNQCRFCATYFTRKHDLKRHVRSKHLCERDFVCAECGSKFVRKSHLDTHLKAFHNSLASYTCKYCGDSFKYDSSRFKHYYRVHPEDFERDKTKKSGNV